MATEAKQFNMQMSQLENTSQPSIKFIESVIKEFEASQRRSLMLQAQDYYQNINVINERTKKYIDRDGIEQESKTATNNKLSHPFLRKLVNQKVNYFLSKPFTVSTIDKTYEEYLSTVFNKRFMKMIKNTAKNAVINGIGWIQVYYTASGKLSFKKIPSEEIIALWADMDHTLLKALLRKYTIKSYNNEGEAIDINKIEYYTDEGVWYYVDIDGSISEDKEKGEGPQGNYEVVTDVSINGETQEVRMQVVWERIPFVAVKYNSDEVPLLQLIKPLVDNYDTITSDVSNNVQDIPNSILVIKNYEGTDKEEFRQNLALYHNIFVKGDGGVEALTMPIDINTADMHLNRLRKDIFDFANGIDTEQVNVGNKSGEALKFIYADLDQDTEDFVNELQEAFQNLAWFIKMDAINNGQGDFSESEFEIIFNKDFIINELEAMDMVTKALSIPGISQKTMIEQVPFVGNAAEEIEAFEAEQAEKQKNDPMFDFGKVVNNNV